MKYKIQWSEIQIQCISLLSLTEKVLLYIRKKKRGLRMKPWGIPERVSSQKEH